MPCTSKASAGPGRRHPSSLGVLAAIAAATSSVTALAEPLTESDWICQRALGPDEQAPPGEPVNHGVVAEPDGSNPQPARIVRSNTCFALIPRPQPPRRTASEQIDVALALIDRLIRQRDDESPAPATRSRPLVPQTPLCPELPGDWPLPGQPPGCVIYSPQMLDARSAS